MQCTFAVIKKHTCLCTGAAPWRPQSGTPVSFRKGQEAISQTVKKKEIRCKLKSLPIVVTASSYMTKFGHFLIKKEAFPTTGSFNLYIEDILLPKLQYNVLKYPFRKFHVYSVLPFKPRDPK